MTKFIFTNSGLDEDIERYSKVIEDKSGMKINYDKDEDYYYYVFNSLTTLLKVINILHNEGIDSGIIISRTLEEDMYVIEVYDDWRE